MVQQEGSILRKAGPIRQTAETISQMADGDVSGGHSGEPLAYSERQMGCRIRQMACPLRPMGDSSPIKAN